MDEWMNGCMDVWMYEWIDACMQCGIPEKSEGTQNI
jgi:hypothetical protein